MLSPSPSLSQSYSVQFKQIPIPASQDQEGKAGHGSTHALHRFTPYRLPPFVLSSISILLPSDKLALKCLAPMWAAVPSFGMFQNGLVEPWKSRRPMGGSP